MSCGCKEKDETPYFKDGPPVPVYRCQCGTARLLPINLKHGQRFQLDPCPKCGVGCRGTFYGNKAKIEDF
jgi:hypothetical protein